MIAKIIPWALVLILGIFVGTLFHNNTEQAVEITNLRTDNNIKLEQIEKRDSIITIYSNRIDSLDTIQVRVANSIAALLENDNKIKDEFKNLYLNPDSSDWHKLDSLASIILHR